ncbi:hypothetical protein IKF02_01360 [Candidatus Saccharibacteria bacterium]|nr:hypothetical protein [Candidatus Saccharibacteria bacterium]MBR3204735.1 hypothetical protein [Candidatus Saccharibacteria bacterium]
MPTPYHSPLYPLDEEVDSLESAAREAEDIDDFNKLKKKHKQKQEPLDDEFDDSTDDIFDDDLDEDF